MFITFLPFKSSSVATWVGDTFTSFFSLLQSSNHVTFTTFITPQAARRLTSFFSLPRQKSTIRCNCNQFKVLGYTEETVAWTYSSEGAPSIICVSFSFNKIWRDPPPLRIILSSLNNSFSSKPTREILQFDKYRSSFSASVSSATWLSTCISFASWTPGAPTISVLLIFEESPNEAGTHCDVDTESSIDVAGTGWKLALALLISGLCCSLSEVFKPLEADEVWQTR